MSHDIDKGDVLEELTAGLLHGLDQLMANYVQANCTNHPQALAQPHVRYYFDVFTSILDMNVIRTMPRLEFNAINGVDFAGRFRWSWVYKGWDVLVDLVGHGTIEMVAIYNADHMGDAMSINRRRKTSAYVDAVRQITSLLQAIDMLNDSARRTKDDA